VETAPTDPEAPDLEQDADGAYLMTDAEDFGEAASWPAEDYRLAGDIDAEGSDLARLGAGAPFTGDLDGAGYRITGFTSTTGGLFGTIAAEGRVHDLTVEAAVSGSSSGGAGIRVATTHGTIERVATAGSVEAPTRAGGIAGTSFGTIRDS